MRVNINWSMCRVCLSEINRNDEVKKIFEMDSDKVEINKKITECSGIEIKKDENLPEQICKTCLKHLNVAYKFRKTCHITNERLQIFVNKANDFLISETLEMTESLDVPDIASDEINDDATRLDYENENDFVEYIIQEDEIEIGENEKNMKDVLYEESSVNFVTLYENQDKQMEKDPISDGKYIIKSPLHKSPLHDENIMLGNYKIDDDSLFMHDDQSKTSDDHNVNFYELQLDNDSIQLEESNECNENIKIKRKYSKKNKNDIFSCDLCGNKFKHKYSLDVHMRLHTNEKPFVCEICSKDFALNFQLSRHMRVHTGEKPYTCKFCNRKFRDISTKIKHERIHTNERPFKCTYCPKDFIYSDVCKRHIATHTGIRPYECVPCNKKFAQPYHLKAHLATLSHKSHVEHQFDKAEYYHGDQSEDFVFCSNDDQNSNLIEAHQDIKL